MDPEIRLAFCTFPDAETAHRIVAELVELRLVACGNVLPQIQSIYRWQGKVETAEEVLAIFKLSAGGYSDFENKLRSLHPYELPEIISCRLDQGLPEYLRWVTESCEPVSGR